MSGQRKDTQKMDCPICDAPMMAASFDDDNGCGVYRKGTCINIRCGGFNERVAKIAGYFLDIEPPGASTSEVSYTRHPDDLGVD